MASATWPLPIGSVITHVTVATWRTAVCRQAARSLRINPAWGSTQDRRRQDRRSGDDHSGEAAHRGNALEHAVDGQGIRLGAFEADSSHLAGVLPPSHRGDAFKLSNDPLFVEKVRDIVGLYLDPPDRALVLCVDEKTQIQALDRTQPVLPLGLGQPERRTHDYMRHGTTLVFFAALDVQSGKVIGKCMPRHRAAEFRRFLRILEKSLPARTGPCT